MLFIARPVVVLSFDSKRKKSTALILSPDTVIRGGFGYGEFPLRSLLTLDGIDKREGNLLRVSVSRALGLPVTHVIDREGVTIEQPVSVNSLRQLVAIRSKPFSFEWGEWLWFVRTMTAVPVDGLSIIDLTSATVPENLPDGSQQFVLDEARTDALIGSELFDADLRTESVSVALYNTTDAPSIGRVIGRQLTHVGIRLVLVGNKPTLVDRCRIVGSNTSLRTYTASYLRFTYGCETVTDDNSGKDVGADIVFELGHEEATQYK